MSSEPTENKSDYYDPTVKYVPLKPIENRMNEIDPQKLSKYLDPEFITAKPDSVTKDSTHLELEDKEKIRVDLDLNDIIQDKLEEEKKEAATLHPREYQFELYEKALHENVITVLDTGAGKTLISIMLIKKMVLEERQARLTRRETKLAFFLVERVPLVFQQANVIRTNCDVRLEEMCGEMNVDSWSEKKWKQVFEENDICVMTAQIFLDCLYHGFIKLEQVHLMIFDECHHATKKHPFNLIMREFYDRCPVDKRPKIFGMTASPMHARSSVIHSVQQLEKNLNSKVYTAQNLELLDISTNKPHEVIVEYFPAPKYTSTELTLKIGGKLSSVERYQRCFIIAEEILATLGPWCCDRMWKVLLSKLEQKMVRATQGLDRNSLIDEDLALKETHELIDPIEFPRNPDINDRTLFTSKIAKLIAVLGVVVNKLNDFCGIIFVERRHTALALQTVIESLDLLNKARCGVLIGHGSTDEGDIQMSFKEQNKVIEKFRTGELNLLIATSVAEEGLDIQPCNVVIRFDFFHTLIGYIQSRGRARKKDSKYVILVEQEKKAQLQVLNEFRGLEQSMKRFCQMLPDDRNVAKKFSVDPDFEYSSDEELTSDEDEDHLEDAYFVPETGATVTKQNAVALIHRYCSSLPSDSFCTLKPIFEIIGNNKGYVCKLILPSNAPFQELESPVVGSKNKAKAMVALKACEKLRHLRALDEHLMPKNLKKEILGEMSPQYDENGYIIGSRRRHGLYEKRTPGFWDRDIEEDEEIAIEDNPDLLQAQVLHTTVATEEPNIHRNTKSEETSLVNNDILGAENKIGENTSNSQSLNIPDQNKKPINIISVSSNEVTNGTSKPQDVFQNSIAESKLELESKAGGEKDASMANLEDSIRKLTIEDTKVNGTENQVSVLQDESTKDEVNDVVVDELEEGPFTCWFTLFEPDLPKSMCEDIPHRQLCLVTKKPFPTLPDLKLFHQSVPFMVHLRSLETKVIFEREKILVLCEYMLKLMTSIANKEFICPPVDVPYYIVPLIKNTKNLDFEKMSGDELENLIDWREIDTITQSKIIEFSVGDPEYDPTDSIIVDFTDNMRRYYVKDVRYDMSPRSHVPENAKIRESGYPTFLDYYIEKKLVNEETDLNQPMLQVKRLKKVMNFLYPGNIIAAQTKGPESTWTLPSFCKRFFVSASVYQAIMMIPSIMTRIDSLLLIKQSRERYDLPITDEHMLEAYTTPSASMEMNYERLETLGDSFLKFIATIRLYINFPFSNEGELHHLRIRVICNRALYRSAKRLKFYRYVTSQAFNRRYWRPPRFVSPADNEEVMEGLKYHKLSDKTLADIVEATLGAAYISNGVEGGLHAAIQLQVPFDEIKTWSDFNTTFEESRKKVPPRAEIKALRSLDLPRITNILGREFNKPLLIVEALTHASLPNSTAPCYQRLEFLGDAILDFLVIRYLYSKYPDADPGIITDLKDSCVNNHILGIICVETTLYKHIIHYSGRLVRAIQLFVNEVEDAKNSGEAVGEYWTDFNIPKVLSDVVESLLGATFVDAGFRLEACEELFEKWFIPILDNHVTPELIKIHPLRKFITDLQRFGCDSFMLRNHCTGETGPESQKCVIFLHDKPLACGSDWNIKTARRHAATKAMERLQEEPDLLESVCNCRVSLIKRGLAVDTKNKLIDQDDDEY